MYVLLYFVSALSVVVTSQTNLPVGHLKPLGGHRPPSVHIDEFNLSNAPDVKTFYEEYVRENKAAIFRGVLKDTKAFQQWDDDYVKANFGDLEVRLEGKKEKSGGTPIGEKFMGRDRLSHFVDHYHSANTYVVSELPGAMFGDVGVLPSFGACGALGGRIVEVDLWWSGGDAHSVMHKDAFNQINCLHRGAKVWKLFEFKYEKWLHKHWEPENEVGGYSDINVEAVDMIAHPNIAKVPWSNFTINAGDCLFLPKSYYHQVDSFGSTNLAVSLLFSRLDGVEHIDTTDCSADTDFGRLRPLSEFPVMWEWRGEGNMSMGNADLVEMRESLVEQALIREEAGASLDLGFLELEFGSEEEDDGKLREGNPVAALAALDSDGDGRVSSREVRGATLEELRAFSLELEPYEPSNTEDFEFSLIDFYSVEDLVRQVMRMSGKFSREAWRKAYSKVLGGTEAFADKIFTGLVGSEDINVAVSNEITPQRIRVALERWVYYWAPQYSGSSERPRLETKPEKAEL